ncbi:hypothetical protein EDD16DRAFT_1717982 [Pisolithus croceorrhizus]|nr:hypothetical protein EDD16DRAFT_1717982 [Pisolithus croceorrhizus]
MPRFPPERPSADESSAEEEKFRELSGDEQEEIALHDGEDSVVERKGALEIAKAGGEEVDIAVEEATAPQNGPGKGVERRCRVAHQNAGSEEKAGDQNEIRGRLRLASSVEVARTTREKEP